MNYTIELPDLPWLINYTITPTPTPTPMGDPWFAPVLVIGNIITWILILGGFYFFYQLFEKWKP